MKLIDADQYQPAAQRVFIQLQTELSLALPYARIEHIGSSAIPGALSKGDIDICVAVPKKHFTEALGVLESKGYRIKVDTLRTPQLCMLISPRESTDLAIQLIEQGSDFEFFM